METQSTHGHVNGTAHMNGNGNGKPPIDGSAARSAAKPKPRPRKQGNLAGAALEKLFPGIAEKIDNAKRSCPYMAQALIEYEAGLAEFRSIRAGGAVPTREFKCRGELSDAGKNLRDGIGDLSEALLCISQKIRSALAGADYKDARFDLPMLPVILSACDRACELTWLFVDEMLPRPECADLLLDATGVIALLDKLGTSLGTR